MTSDQGVGRSSRPECAIANYFVERGEDDNVSNQRVSREVTMPSKRVSYSYLKSLKKSSVAWSLLRTQEFVISFLHTSFIMNNRRSIPYEDLKSELSDYLYFLNQEYGDQAPKDSAQHHLKRWTDSEDPFLSVRYDKKNIEVLDLTPGAEKALRWVESLEEREFVGTESRLKNIFNQLEELIEGTEMDTKKAIKRLEQKRDEIERQIEMVKTGRKERLSPRKIKESFIQIEDESRNLLSDFRQIEENFRKLDRNFRKKIASTDGSKGKVLNSLFGDHDAIYDSDQGKSFLAFWEFLMQEGRTEEIYNSLRKVLYFKEVTHEKQNSILANFVHYLIDAAERVNSVNNQLTSQLKRFLNDRTILENKRIMEIINSLEESLLFASNSIGNSKAPFLSIDLLYPSINMGLSRSIYVPSNEISVEFNEEDKENNDEGYGPLFHVNYVDEEELMIRIDFLLSKRDKVSLAEIVDNFPIEKGLTEVACYYNIAERKRPAQIHTKDSICIDVHSSEGFHKNLECPDIIFQRP